MAAARAALYRSNCPVISLSIRAPIAANSRGQAIGIEGYPGVGQSLSSAVWSFSQSEFWPNHRNRGPEMEHGGFCAKERQPRPARRLVTRQTLRRAAARPGQTEIAAARNPPTNDNRCRLDAVWIAASDCLLRRKIAWRCPLQKTGSGSELRGRRHLEG